jgi:hypothetical protein
MGPLFEAKILLKITTRSHALPLDMFTTTTHHSTVIVNQTTSAFSPGLIKPFYKHPEGIPFLHSYPLAIQWWSRKPGRPKQYWLV